VHSDLGKCTHVFFHQDTTCRALESSCSDPYRVLSWREKTLQLLVCGRPVTMSADRVKPAYMLSGTDRGNSSFNQPADATPIIPPPATPPLPATARHCPPHTLHAQDATSISLLTSTSEQPSPIGGRGVMWEPPTVQRALSILALKNVSPDAHWIVRCLATAGGKRIKMQLLLGTADTVDTTPSARQQELYLYSVHRPASSQPAYPTSEDSYVVLRGHALTSH
jgi:hypothetical protein